LEPGAGSTPAQKAVKRIAAKDFIMVRTQYLEADPNGFRPHEECHWTDENRENEIQALCSKVMELGDVTKFNKAKPPSLEECKPLQVNEETRWKSKAMARQSSVMQDDTAAEESTGAPESEEEIVGKALLILNKISWTTLDKLTVRFMEQTNLQENESIRHACIDMLIKKAQMEQHFGPMYAQLCAIISKQFKPFKKDLLVQCQAEFETDTAHKIAKATEGITDPDDIEYHSTLIRKAYIGHIKFLGELYLRDVVKLAIMLYCLEELLKVETDEENLECFAHLMTTMGEKLDEHSKQNNKPFDWAKVEQLRNSPKISNRIKFLLQDLLELKDRGKIYTLIVLF
jgi:translation initiation factor 4G